MLTDKSICLVHMQISEISLLMFYVLNFTTINFIFVLLYLQLLLWTFAITGQQRMHKVSGFHHQIFYLIFVQLEMGKTCTVRSSYF